MITDTQFNEWAQSSTKHPILLVEITHKTGKVYLSDHVYFTNATDTPAHVSYDVCLKQAVLVERTLDQDSVGAIRVYNDGSLDHWLDLLFIGYEIEILIGDKSWNRADFRRQFNGTIDSFEQLSGSSYEFKSTLATSIVQSIVFNKYNSYTPWIAGNHTSTKAMAAGKIFGMRRYRIAAPEKYNRNDVTITYGGNPASLTWIDDTWTTNTFYVTDHFDGTLEVKFACPTVDQKFKALFASVCAHVNQPINAANLAAYPIDPDITLYISENMPFPEFLAVSLETLGALLWINDEGEIELYRKELPELIEETSIVSFFTPNDDPVIKTITEELPAAAVQIKNPDYNHNSEDGPNHFEYNAIDLTYPYRTVITHSYAKDSEAIIEGRRLADLLSVTRRTYSVTINRISPELFIGAIVNIYSPEDRWEENGQGLNALVVGFTQSFKSNKSELIVWR